MQNGSYVLTQRAFTVSPCHSSVVGSVPSTVDGSLGSANARWFCGFCKFCRLFCWFYRFMAERVLRVPPELMCCYVAVPVPEFLTCMCVCVCVCVRVCAYLCVFVCMPVCVSVMRPLVWEASSSSKEVCVEFRGCGVSLLQSD